MCLCVCACVQASGTLAAAALTAMLPGSCVLHVAHPSGTACAVALSCWKTRGDSIEVLITKEELKAMRDALRCLQAPRAEAPPPSGDAPCAHAAPALPTTTAWGLASWATLGGAVAGLALAVVILRRR